MRERARNAVRGSVGFAIGVFFAVSLAFLGFRILSLILGSAIAGGSLAWRERSFRFIVLASLGAVLGLLLGGLLVLMSFGELWGDIDSSLGQPSFGNVLSFYLLFVFGFAVAGATIATATASRLVTPYNCIKAFGAAGVIGGALIIGAERIKVMNFPTLVAALAISVVVAGGLCGASLNSVERDSLSIVDDDRSTIARRIDL